jgi:hypothetical protein
MNLLFMSIKRLNKEIRVWAALSHPNIHKLCGFIRDFGGYEHECMVSRVCASSFPKLYREIHSMFTVVLKRQLPRLLEPKPKTGHSKATAIGRTSLPNYLRVQSFTVTRCKEWLMAWRIYTL